MSVQDYLHSLGKARTAQVQKDARIGEAQYKRDAVIRVILILFVPVQSRFIPTIVLEQASLPFSASLGSFSTQEAHAMQEKVSAQYKNEIEMAKAQRDYELKKADYDIEVNTKKAESEMAYQLQVPPPRAYSSSLIKAPFKRLIRVFRRPF